MKRILATVLLLVMGMDGIGSSTGAGGAAAPARNIFVVPIREDIMPPLVYLVRRGVKDAMEAEADLLVLDMETNGGRVDVTEEIISIVGQFKGRTATFVNRKAFSAGAFIAFGTQKIFMAPQSVIGAAAPIMMSPGGTGVEAMPDTMEVKTVSAISALVRANAEKNGHNVEVADAMVKKTKELKIDGKVLNEKGQILTLTNLEAEKEYGQPAKPLLSAGTVESLDALLKQLGAADAKITRLEPTGAEKLATWINAISPILLILGAAGLYIEFKTPGFGLPGIIGITAFVIYFLGGYVAGLSGMEWLAVFVLGVALMAVELFVFPGTMVAGLAGLALIVVSLLMAAVDWYPGTPSLPTLPQLQLPLTNLLIAAAGSTVVMWALSIWLPRSAYFERLVPRTASGVASVEKKAAEQAGQIGLVGVAVSPLRPGGKAQFGEQILDVITDGGMIARGARVKIISHSGTEAVVEAVGEAPAQS